MHKNLLIVCISFFQIIVAFCQEKPELSDSTGYNLLQNVGRHAVNELDMKISPSFYTKWAKNENPNIFVYVSTKDSLYSPLKSSFLAFGNITEEDAKTKSTEYYEKGYDVLIYKTYGTSGTQLSHHLINYSKPSILFIGFHEATHQHISGFISLPYIYIEALCDLIGTQGSLAYTKTHSNENYEITKQFVDKVESLGQHINDCILLAQTYDINLPKSFASLKKEISNLPTNETFLIERYDYEINNAYLIRYESYTKYYFKLKELLTLYDDFSTFWNFIKKLPNDESKINALIDTEIIKLKS
ncbi:MAG TPA: hypothetical protein VK169_04310 [Saprospiraceae bacterium]|nr:hypothetical protein [Saprospiraceae bacterium]